MSWEATTAVGVAITVVIVIVAYVIWSMVDFVRMSVHDTWEDPKPTALHVRETVGGFVWFGVIAGFVVWLMFLIGLVATGWMGIA